MLNRHSQRIPSYSLHKATGQAVVRLNGKDFYLGVYDSPGSRKKYDKLINEWLAQGRQIFENAGGPGGAADGRITIAQLAAAYWSYAQDYYRKPDGRPTSEIWGVKQMLRVIKRLYGDLHADDFSPLKLKAMQQEMIQMKLARSTLNSHISRAKVMFRWAVGNEMVRGEVYHSISAVKGLMRGRSEARETEPVKPVPEAYVDAVIAVLSPSLADIRAIFAAETTNSGRPRAAAEIAAGQVAIPQLAAKLPKESAVAAMIEMQRLTGMRPGEACIMRTGDLTMTSGVWVYRPKEHKTEHHGIEKEIAIGPRAQQILRPFLKADLAAYVFSPADAEKARNHARRESRKTDMTPSALARRRRQRSAGRAGDRYTVASYRRAIERACDHAFPLPADLVAGTEVVKAWRQTATVALGRRPRLADMPEDVRNQFDTAAAYRKQFRWHPHQLRHNAATELRRRYGIEAARVILGHRSAAITEVYAEIDKAKAVQIMNEVG